LLRQVITGGVVSVTVTKLVQKAALPQQSTAFQIAVMVWQAEVLLVVALESVMETFVPQQTSKAVGGRSDQVVLLH
jgi:hypothetical protein